ncbi:rhamnosyltransferase [Abditibacterium utsteinense]|uniref:Rhamnosyltransferase n=1 Tax=Abditibacterium utsteinense TaxID=1960156 RepID=A0A2S8SWP1_9BACT|nr:glycosyltransferase family 2 protein [Abditibacterium utsteinense]PQV65213.1 rhamnosyltransferase [Abditibacterium utsteinense]
MIANPYVSIVLPTFQGDCYLKETLSALGNQDFKKGFELVAIDSESSDQTPQLLKQAKARFFSIPQSQFGHGSTRNFGVKQARGEIIVFLSQDAVPVGRDWLSELTEAVQDPMVGAAYARQLPRPNATPLEHYFHQYFYPVRSRRVSYSGGHCLSLDQLFFSNVCSVARREICERFPFDESLIMSEDQAFSRDLLLSGFSIVYHAATQVIHSHSYNLSSLFRRNFDSGYSLRSLQSEPMPRQLQRASLFLSREVRFLAREKQFRWLLYLPFYEAVRFLALFAGSQADRLPLRVRVACSLHHSFWERK